MANTNSPFGLRPISRAGGAPFSVTMYAKPSTDGQAVFIFDLLGKVAGGSVLPENATYQAPQIGSAYAVFVPGTSFWVGSSLAYGAASTLTFHPVTDEADVIYLCQGKTGTTYSTASHVGKRANISTTTAGSTTTHISGISVDGATIAATSTLDLQVIRITYTVPNIEGANAIFEVVINKHILGQQTAGV